MGLAYLALAFIVSLGIYEVQARIRHQSFLNSLTTLEHLRRNKIK